MLLYNRMDLLQRSIYKSCKLAVPSGLTELMSDISREVLRAQPDDLYTFITDYLAAMLVTRDNMSIAANICKKSLEAPCYEVLVDKLRGIGLDEEDIEKVEDVVLEYFKNDTVNETNLLMELIRKTNIDEETLAPVKGAVREAFKHQYSDPVDCGISENDNDNVSRAVKHTLELYKNTRPSKESYHRMAKRIQASYRAYGVRRKDSNEFFNPRKQVKEVKRVILDVHEDDPATFGTCLRTVSSTTLAGSYMHLPKYRPYSPHDSNPLINSEENSGRRTFNNNYIELVNTREDSTEDDTSESPEKVIELHHANEENCNDKDNINNNLETHEEDTDNSEGDEYNIQEELFQVSNDEISDGSIGEVIYEDKIDEGNGNDNYEIEEIIDYISDPEEGK